MVTVSSLLAHQDTLGALLLNLDENVRAALLCWAVALSAFVILGIPRQVLLGCLVAATATVGLAATVVDLTPERPAGDTARAMPREASERTTTLMKGHPQLRANGSER